MRTFVRRILRPFQTMLRRLGGAPKQLLEEMPDAPALFTSYRALLASGHKRVPGGWVYEGEFYPDYLTVGGNAFAIRRIALKYCQGGGLDIGAAFWPLPGSIPIDTEQGPGLANRIEDIPPASQDYVFSSHCLEHIGPWEEALDAWVEKLRPGGVLFLYLPHPTCKLWHYSNPFMAGIHRWAPEPSIIEQALLKRGLIILDKDKGPDHFCSFYYCARKPTAG